MTAPEEAAARRAAYGAVLKDWQPMNFKRPQPGENTMTEPSEAAKRKACEVANEASDFDRTWEQAMRVHGSFAYVALARVLQEHSDVAKVAIAAAGKGWGLQEAEVRGKLQPLILPEESDPLEDMIGILRRMPGPNEKHDAEWFRLELAERGLKIVEDDNA